MDGTRRIALRWEALIVASVTGVAALAVLHFGADGPGPVLSVAAQTAAALLAAAACVAVGVRAMSWARAAWCAIGAGAACWAGANMLWAVSGEAGGTSLVASIADAGFLALFPLALIGLLLHPVAPRGPAGLTRLVLDGFIAAGSLRLVAWILVLEDAHRDAAPGGHFHDVAGYAQAVGDFVLVTIAILVALRAGRGRRGSLLLVAAGFTAIGVGDGVFTFQVLEGTYESGAATDLWWIGGFAVLGLGARWEARLPFRSVARTGDVDEQWVTLFLPAAVVLPAVALAVPRTLDGTPLDSSMVWNAVIVAVLVLARQVADRYDNVHLVRSLRARVSELRDRDAQLAEAQEISRLGSWEWDVVGGSITRTDQAYRIFGLEPGTPLPERQGLLAHVHPDDRQRVQHSVTRSMETGEAFRVDFRVAAVDGRIVHARGRIVHDEEGSAVRMVGTVQDVTTVRRLARELEQRLDELERSNRDLAHFASVASHDLAAPVQLLLGHLRLLSRRVREQGDRIDVELVEGAIRGAHRLEELIQDILAYSLAGVSGEELRTMVDTDRVAREAARAVGSDRWAVSVDFGRLPTIEAHPGQIRQLFQNLLSNAFKFVPPGRTPRVRVWADQVDGIWRFSVADNGVGVPEPERARIFRIFQRGAAHGDTTGSGIGLAICTRIVTRHGGRIWCAPGPDGGSIFSFTLADQATAAFEDDLAEVRGA